MGERPPSEQGPEWDALDKLDELLAAIHAGQRFVGPWWDMLPAEVGAVLVPSNFVVVNIPTTNPTAPIALRIENGAAVTLAAWHNSRPMRADPFVPYLDLTMVDPTGYPLWRKRLYCGQPANPNGDQR